MARGLVESTADFLTTGMDEYFSGLHDLDDNEKLWYVNDGEIMYYFVYNFKIFLFFLHSFGISPHSVKVLQSCRDFKKLFKETRERSIKALCLVKRLRTDLGVAATFNVNVSFPELLEKLKAASYMQVNISTLIKCFEAR